MLTACGNAFFMFDRAMNDSTLWILDGHQWRV
jgi:hypothetical protein